MHGYANKCLFILPSSKQTCTFFYVLKGKHYKTYPFRLKKIYSTYKFILLNMQYFYTKKSH